MITGGTSMPVAPVAVLADDRLKSCVPALGAEDDEEDVDAEAGNWIELGGWAIVERAHVWAVDDAATGDAASGHPPDAGAYVALGLGRSG